MKVFMAGTSGLKNHPELMRECDYFLESFISIKDWQMPYFKKAKGFLLDSGAFTFMNGTKAKNIYEYAEKYANFINEYDINDFFELDVEMIFGWNEYLKMNDLIEKITKKQSIPVFHKNRGLKWYINACENYDYIAFGGVAVGAGKVRKSMLRAMPEFIKIAHSHDTRIHGLGFTMTSRFDEIRFDTIDSTTWTMGGRMGNLCYFTGDGMRQYYPSKNGKKPRNLNDLNAHNFSEWLKFQKWADVNLGVLK